MGLTDRLVDGLAERAQEMAGEVVEVLRVAREQPAAVADERMEALQDLELRGAREIDHRVAAEDRGERALDVPFRLDQVDLPERDPRAQLLTHPGVAAMGAVAPQEEAAQPFLAGGRRATHPVDAILCGAQRVRVPV